MTKLSYDEYQNLQNNNDSKEFCIIYNKNSGRVGLIFSDKHFYSANDLVGLALLNYPAMLSFDTKGYLDSTVLFDEDDDLYLLDPSDLPLGKYQILSDLFEKYITDDKFADSTYFKNPKWENLIDFLEV